ncbi:MAG: hypothetical protein ICV70_04240 [Jiangellaceae bacterium]|nr:hypothetical protein [Jiangellaceae bacterium]
MPVLLSPDAVCAALSVRDLADPDQGRHAMQLLVDEAAQAITRSWPTEVRIIRARPIVSIEDNYDRLGYAPDAVARDTRYTRYVSESCLLRSHASAGVPLALRRLAAAADPPADVTLLLPGICHRRDAIDRLHTGTPHQLDVWRVRRDRGVLDHADLADLVTVVLGTVLPRAEWRWHVASHPYTIGGREIEVLHAGDPVEVAECGVAAPQVLDRAGLPASKWSGLALGIGLDRTLMLRKGVPDIRLLRSPDPRVQRQLLDLAPYQPVSNLPPARRDVSVAVNAESDEETLGDQVRDALGADADLVEEVRILATTPYDALTEPARRRLGIRPDQHNVLLRIVLRPTDRTLMAGEANDLRDRIYAALHEGAC